LSEDAAQPPEEDPQEGSPQPDDLSVPDHLLAQAAQEGAEAGKQGDRLDAARTGILQQQVDGLQTIIGQIAFVVDTHFDKASHRAASSMSSRDTAYFEGRREMALDLMTLLGQLGISLPQEGP
jgi:hypothetical protein